jgi:hypothetical protein
MAMEFTKRKCRHNLEIYSTCVLLDVSFIFFVIFVGGCALSFWSCFSVSKSLEIKKPCIIIFIICCLMPSLAIFQQYTGFNFINILKLTFKWKTNNTLPYRQYVSKILSKNRRNRDKSIPIKTWRLTLLVWYRLGYRHWEDMTKEQTWIWIVHSVKIKCLTDKAGWSNLHWDVYITTVSIDWKTMSLGPGVRR